MKATKVALVLTLGILMTSPSTADSTAPDHDLTTIQGMMDALYGAISGPAGEARDWDFFASLFYEGARLMPIGHGPDTVVVQVASPAEYAEQVTPYFNENPFFEIETARTVDTFGHLTHVFSTYESRRSPDDAEPFDAGINSIQMIHDGTRYWILTIAWDRQMDMHMIPEKYLPKP